MNQIVSGINSSRVSKKRQLNASFTAADTRKSPNTIWLELLKTLLSTLRSMSLKLAHGRKSEAVKHSPDLVDVKPSYNFDSFYDPN